jgi:hypothetical protein
MVTMKKYVMKSTLKPFQKDTLKWMEKREHLEGGGYVTQ